tara:strand:- start:3438 stop:3548 length:111 start_codon:yes stop_codon:yes gene_type:complete
MINELSALRTYSFVISKSKELVVELSRAYQDITEVN